RRSSDLSLPARTHPAAATALCRVVPTCLTPVRKQRYRTGTTWHNVGGPVQRTYKASKSRSQREGWCVLFRHPLRQDREGRPLRLRLGLGTKDEEEAEQLVAELNVLLSDETYWPLAARERDAR